MENFCVIITPKETVATAAALLLRPSSSAAAAVALLPLYMYIHCFSELRRIIQE
jgi:hypothetical protein